MRQKLTHSDNPRDGPKATAASCQTPKQSFQLDHFVGDRKQTA
jgi:hypothetical protein